MRGRLVFSQLMDHLPLHTFRRQVNHYQGDRYAKRFRCMDQFLCMAFAQLTYRESLRDIETCLRAHRSELYHMGIRSNVARSTLADANDSRNWRIYADFAHSLIAIARRLYADKDFFFIDTQSRFKLLYFLKSNFRFKFKANAVALGPSSSW
jgi:hypothetical protein